MRLLAERFASVEHDGPHAYAGFLADSGDADEIARLRQEAVAIVRTFLSAADFSDFAVSPARTGGWAVAPATLSFNAGDLVAECRQDRSVRCPLLGAPRSIESLRLVR